MPSDKDFDKGVVNLIEDAIRNCFDMADDISRKGNVITGTFGESGQRYQIKIKRVRKEKL